MTVKLITIMSKFIKYLQGWIAVVAMMAFGNTVSCFRGHQFLADNLYTGATSDGKLRRCRFIAYGKP